MHEEETFQLDTPLLNDALKTAMFLVAASFLFKATMLERVNGEIMYFRDWAAIICGTAAIGAALIGLKTALSKLERHHRALRILLIAAMMALGGQRVLYGFGMFL